VVFVYSDAKGSDLYRALGVIRLIFHSLGLMLMAWAEACAIFTFCMNKLVRDNRCVRPAITDVDIYLDKFQ
jgi:hypothetical protein